MNQLSRGCCAFGFAIVFALAGASCSVDRNTHPDRRKDCGPDLMKFQEYCVPKPAPDAGPMVVDSGGDAGIDAEMPETCEETGLQKLCYPHADTATAQQPPCRPGLSTCGEDHVWSRCDGHVLPETDGCDGRDNDCDGQTDEEQLQKSCTVKGNVRGACAEGGLALCRGGREDCVQVVTPQPETCNSVDDDCDGTTDEGIEVACYGGGDECQPNALQSYDCVPASTCAPGMLRCVGGKMQTECADDVRPTAEAETQVGQVPLDEDCDGAIDEEFSCQTGEDYPCYTGPANTRGVTPCKDGTQQCTGGQFGECENQKLPEPETCANDGEDDDCDGTPDNVPRRGTSCGDVSTAQGSCKAQATWQCADNVERCVNGAMATEICDGRNEDEDCDGNVDEGFDKQQDEDNCGSCGTRCGAGLSCCGGRCVNMTSSNSHCGSCTNMCNTGLTCCNRNCVNTLNNTNNCGTCGRTCLLGCSNGGCNLL